MVKHQRGIFKKSGIFAFFISISTLVSMTTIIASASTELSSVQHLLPYLKLDDAVTYISKLFGQIIFWFASSLNNLVENSFMHIAKLDLFALIPDLAIFESRTSSVISSIFMMTLAGFILVRMFQQREMGSIFTNAIIVGMSILLFTNFVSLADEGRVVLIDFIDESIGESMTTTDRIFLDNTYDLKYLISEANNGNNIVVTLREQGFTDESIEYVSWDERLSKDIIGEKYIMNEYTAEKTVSPVRDGMWGIGDERYFRYHISYAKINSAVAITFFVYALALIKGSFIIYDLTIGRFLGKWAGLRGMGDYTETAKPYVYYIQSIVSILILFILVSLYPTISGTIFSLSEEQMPIIVKLIICFVAGIVILYGSDFTNNVLGFEGARRTLLTSMMMKRGAKSLTNAGKKGFDSAKNLFENSDTKDTDSSYSSDSNAGANEHSKPDNHNDVSNNGNNNFDAKSDLNNKADSHMTMGNRSDSQRQESDHDNDIDQLNQNRGFSQNSQNVEESPRNNFKTNIDDRDNIKADNHDQAKMQGYESSIHEQAKADNNMDDDNPQILSNKHMYGFQSKDENDEQSKPDNHSFNDDYKSNNELGNDASDTPSYPTEKLTFKNGDFVSSSDEELYKNHMNDFSKEYGNLFSNGNRSNDALDNDKRPLNESKKRKR